MRHTFAALRVLVVLPFLPLPEGGAAARCAVGLLSGLSQLGVQYHALAASPVPVDAHELPSGLPIEVVQLDLPSPWQARRERLLRPKGMLGRGAFAARTRALAAEADVVHFVGAETAVSLSLVDRPAIVQLDFLTRRDRPVSGPWSREGRIAIELLRAEHRARRRARWLLANSPQVAHALQGASRRRRVWVSPLALDPRYYSPRARLRNAAAGLIGMARWPPTRKAVERLLADVWPLVLRRMPEAHLLLAGYDMERSRFAESPERAGVQWRAKVPSATDFLRELGLLIYPLTAGSGAKVKVLEALALGVPVITTPDGAEGLGGLGGVTVQTDDAKLAEAAAALLGDEQRRLLAGEAAYRTFREHHSPAVAAASVLELYERVAC